MRGLWLLAVFGIGAVAFLGWNAMDASVWPPDSLTDVLNACADDGATDLKACVGFLRGSIGKHRRQNTRAALLGHARPAAPCRDLVAEMTDEELVRAFADWGERAWRRSGGATPAHLMLPQFLRDKLGCL